MNYRLIEVDAEFYDSCNHKDVARMGFAERHGLEEIAVEILANKIYYVSRYELRNCMVYNGSQVCFAPSADMVKNAIYKQWLDSIFSVTDNGIVFLWFDPDGVNKFYRVEEMS